MKYTNKFVFSLAIFTHIAGCSAGLAVGVIFLSPDCPDAPATTLLDSAYSVGYHAGKDRAADYFLDLEMGRFDNEDSIRSAVNRLVFDSLPEVER